MDGAGGRVGHFVDVAGGENIVEAGGTGLEEDCCGAVKLEEQLSRVSWTRRDIQAKYGGGRIRTLSPQIVRLDHVRMVNTNLVRARHVSDSRITLKNLVSGNSLLRLMLGIWKRRDDDFSR